MTNISKTVRRESAAKVFDSGEDRAIIITLYPKRIGLRIKGTRTEYSLPIAAALRLAICAEIDAKKTISKSAKRVSELG